MFIVVMNRQRYVNIFIVVFVFNFGLSIFLSRFEGLEDREFHFSIAFAVIS